MNKSFHNAVCYVFYTKLSACANKVQRLNSDSMYLVNLVSVSAIILHLH